MTRFAYDSFAKDVLEGLLEPLGDVKAPLEVKAEIRQIDVSFVPNPNAAADTANLGLLWRFAKNGAIFEPFHNPATPAEICNCLLKQLELRGQLQREANRNRKRLLEASITPLWILTPTASRATINGFRGLLDEDKWGDGVYLLGDYLHTAIVVIHKLPQNPETLWLRLLGRGRVQEKAIDELEALPKNNPFRVNGLRLVTNLKANLQSSDKLEEEDRRLIMKLSPLYVEWEEEALQKGEQQGLQQGVQQGQRLVVENLLQTRFGMLDSQLAAVVDSLLSLTPQEYTPLLLQLSRSELIARFTNLQ